MAGPLRSKDTIGFHFFGPGYGESIVIELPGSDHCRHRCNLKQDPSGLGSIPRDDHYPVLRFVDSLRPTKIHFALLTHPHADHCVGFSRFVRKYSDAIDTVILSSGCMGSKMLAECLTKLTDLDKPDFSDRSVGGPPGLVAHELSEIAKLRKEQRSRFRLWQGNTRPEQWGHVRLTPLTPLLDSIERFDSSLVHALARIRSGNSGHPDYNRTSLSLALRFGRFSALLCGDAVSPMWSESLNKSSADAERTGYDPFEDALPFRLIKIGHHASGEWCGRELARRVLRQAPFISVITPFARGRYPLPKKTAIKDLSRLSSDVIVTNREAAQKSTGMIWNAPKTADRSVKKDLLGHRLDARQVTSPPCGRASRCPRSQCRGGGTLVSSTGDRDPSPHSRCPIRRAK